MFLVVIILKNIEEILIYYIFILNKTKKNKKEKKRKKRSKIDLIEIGIKIILRY